MKKQISVQMIDGTQISAAAYKPRKKRWTANDRTLVLMASLSIVFLAVFAYAPLYGLTLAFKKDEGIINIQQVIKYGTWAGFEQFETFLTDPDFGNIMFNTLGLNILQLLINFPAPIIFAILMSELLSDRFKKVVQTVTFFPHFLSWVIFGGIFLSMLDYDSGIINNLLVNIGIVKEPVDILGGEQYF